MKSFILSLGISALLAANTTNSKACVVEVCQSLHQQSETRDVKNFHAISSSGSYTVNVMMGEEESLSIQGDAEDINKIETVVENGVLRIRTKRNRSSWNSVGKKVTINITAKRLDGLMLSGSGILNLDGVMNSASADIQLSGSGEINADVDTQNTAVALSGSGNVNLSGKTGSVNIVVSGSGDVKAKKLATETGNIKVAGSGNVYISAQKDLNASVFGSGSIKYIGDPNVSINKVGSGNVSKID
nr:DUF2807 domain-containing protein [Pseudopedobacter sp.]